MIAPHFPSQLDDRQSVGPGGGRCPVEPSTWLHGTAQPSLPATRPDICGSRWPTEPLTDEQLGTLGLTRCLHGHENDGLGHLYLTRHLDDPEHEFLIPTCQTRDTFTIRHRRTALTGRAGATAALCDLCTTMANVLGARAAG